MGEDRERYRVHGFRESIDTQVIFGLERGYFIHRSLEY